jgi:hypothetical protein
MGVRTKPIDSVTPTRFDRRVRLRLKKTCIGNFLTQAITEVKMFKRYLLIGFVVMLLVSLGGAVGCTSAPESPSTPPLTSTSAPTPTLSEKVYGLKIAFVSEGSIYVIKPDGTQKIELGKGSDPVWSPDGKKVVISVQSTKKG